MALNQKIKSLEELSLILKELKNSGKKIIHCHGVFDLMHPGHVKHFHAAKKMGDILVVTITPDKYVNKGPDRPIFTDILRAETIAALELVDYVAINIWPNAVETIKKIEPDIYVKGKDYTDVSRDETHGIFLEREAVESIGGKIHFTDEITFSSSSLINEYFEIYPEPVQKFLKNFRSRYSADQIIEMIKSLKDLRVLVIGETILDKYVLTNSFISKPPKGNYIAVRFIDEEVHAGGVLAAANHLANFCDEIELVTAVGGDISDDFVKRHLKGNVNLHLHRQEAPTIVKKRYVDQRFNKLLEVYFLDDRPSAALEKQVRQNLVDIFKKNNGRCDFVLVLDYGHGLITPALINLICSQSRFLAVNAQTNTANMGFNPITKYKSANYFCLDDRELRLAFQDNFTDVPILIKHLAERVVLPGAVAVTRGHLGATIYNPENQEFFETPVLSQKIVDTTGAGDAFLALTAPCIAKGFPLEIVNFIGNVAGTLAVGYLGNRLSIETGQLYKFITALLK